MDVFVLIKYLQLFGSDPTEKIGEFIERNGVKLLVAIQYHDDWLASYLWQVIWRRTGFGLRNARALRSIKRLRMGPSLDG